MKRGLLIAIIFVMLAAFVNAENCTDKVDVHFFYSKTCPHCEEQKPLMKFIDANNSNVHVNFYEVSERPDKFEEYKEMYNVTSNGVPRTFVGEKTFIGYSETDGPLEYNKVYQGYTGYRNQIVLAIEDLAGDIKVPGEKESFNPANVFFLVLIYGISYFFLKDKLRTPQSKRFWVAGFVATIIISAFLFITFTPDTMIKNFAQGLPFPLFVLIVALADGFNPCAFTVLIILLSLLTYTKSRKDMSIIGGTFILTSAVMYFIFIMLMILVGKVFIEKYGILFMRILGSGILIAGTINIKDYLFFKKGVSLSLSSEQQSKITRKASKVVRNLKGAKGNSKKLIAAIAGTFLLAIFVNLVELGCTAILPSVYMTTLVTSFENMGTYIFWTVIYAVIYIIPLFAILFNFIFSFKSARMTEAQGRVLKLVGGLFMLLFGFLMIIRPEALSFG